MSSATFAKRFVPETLRACAFDFAPNPLLVFTAEGALVAANEAAERLFGQSLGFLHRHLLSEALPTDSALPSMISKSAGEGAVVREPMLEVALPDLASFEADAASSPLPDGLVLLTLTIKAPGPALDRTADTLRSVAGMGRTLAHEIKNPLAGIRGAAQLLRDGAPPEDAALAQVIVDETDRIRRLIDRVEAFSDNRETDRRPVNVHRILDRVRVLMAAGQGTG